MTAQYTPPQGALSYAFRAEADGLAPAFVVPAGVSTRAAHFRGGNAAAERVRAVPGTVIVDLGLVEV